MFRISRLFTLSLLVSAVIGGVAYLSSPKVTQADPNETKSNSQQVPTDGQRPDPDPAYKDVDLHAGLWNNGTASEWDLPFLDHFKIFGPPQRAAGHRPEQPIHFSHVTHVQKNKMECQYCHWSVGKAGYAAIPEVQTCAGCHASLVPGAPPRIPGTTDEQKTQIKKLVDYWEQGRAIEWVKVHVMPDYIRFNHKRHVKAGVTCQQCHGQVPKMEVVERATSMKMGWCVDCHRQKGATIDCYACHY